MNSIFSKLSLYQILTNLLPGAFFVWMLRVLFDVNILSESVFEEVLTYYFIGFIINRIGSIIVVRVLENKLFSFVKRKPHSDFIYAESIDPKISVLSEVNNCIRSFLTSILILPIAYGAVSIYSRYEWFAAHWMWFAILFLIVLFFFAHKKQTALISRRIEEVIDVNDKQNAE